jgi:hypothetical protein
MRRIEPELDVYVLFRRFSPSIVRTSPIPGTDFRSASALRISWSVLSIDAPSGRLKTAKK